MTPTPDPDPTPGAPCTNCTAYTGTLAPGGSHIQPNNTSYTASAGTHTGYLRGPAGADYDLYLYRWNGKRWVVAARGEGSTSDETVTYNGAAGSYYWVVKAYAGSGPYTFWLARP